MSVRNPRLAALGPSPEDASAMLFADEVAVRHLSEQLRCLGTGEWSAQLVPPPIAEEPHLQRLILRTTDTGLLVTLEGEALVVAGGPALLRRFADDLDLYADYNDLDEPGMHWHVDRSDYPANDAWIAADSVPLMVASWIPE